MVKISDRAHIARTKYGDVRKRNPKKGEVNGWIQKENKPTYIVWSRPFRKGYNTFSVVVKREGGKWVTFVDGQDAGVSVINRGGTKKENQ
ncbi:MAG: hypothetical protein V3U02_05785 [Calditrichia bacterium]